MKARIFSLLMALVCPLMPAAAQTCRLSNPDATRETKETYRLLSELAGKYVLFGHQDDMSYGIGWWAESGRSDVKSVTGSYPAVFGWDIGHIGEEKNIDNVLFPDMKKWIVEAYEAGGINTISWHMKNPANNSNSWDTAEAVSLIIPGGRLFEAYKEKLNKVAEFFLSLKTPEGVLIPVIFRPFHEVSGDWFWWGGKNSKPADYARLWEFTKQYLEKEKGVNNLIWCYSSDRFDSEEEFFGHYPGDNFVDILGFDDYQSPVKCPSHFVWELKAISEYARQRNKIATISETGLETIPKADYWTKNLLKGILESKAAVSYVLVWRNGRPDHYYAPYPGQISSEDFIRFKKHRKILFLDEFVKARQNVKY